MRPWKLTLDIDATHKYDGENSGTKVAYFIDTMASKAWCQTITSYNINVTRKYGYQQNYDDAFKVIEEQFKNIIKVTDATGEVLKSTKDLCNKTLRMSVEIRDQMIKLEKRIDELERQKNTRH